MKRKYYRRCGECGKKHEQSEMIRTRFSDNGWLCQDCYEKATDFVTDEDCGYLEDEEW